MSTTNFYKIKRVSLDTFKNSVTPDNNTIYFVSKGDGEDATYDIYVGSILASQSLISLLKEDTPSIALTKTVNGDKDITLSAAVKIAPNGDFAGETNLLIQSTNGLYVKRAELLALIESTYIAGINTELGTKATIASVNTKAPIDNPDFTGTPKINGVNIPTVSQVRPNTWTPEVNDIPNLPASKITSEQFNADRIPNLAQSKITGLVDALSGKANSADVVPKTLTIAELPLSTNISKDALKSALGVGVPVLITTLGHNQTIALATLNQYDKIILEMYWEGSDYTQNRTVYGDSQTIESKSLMLGFNQRTIQSGGLCVIDGTPVGGYTEGECILAGGEWTPTISETYTIYNAVRLLGGDSISAPTYGAFSRINSTTLRFTQPTAISNGTWKLRISGVKY